MSLCIRSEVNDGVTAFFGNCAPRRSNLCERLQAQLEATHKSKFVAIEPDSQEYFLGNTLSEAIQAARRAYPGRKSFAMRIGEPMHLGVLFS